MKYKAIFRYKHRSEFIVSVQELPLLSVNNPIGKFQWNDLIINFGPRIFTKDYSPNDIILSDKPYNFTLEFFGEDGNIHSKFIILEVSSYKEDNNSIRVAFRDLKVL